MGAYAHREQLTSKNLGRVAKISSIELGPNCAEEFQGVEYEGRTP
jgi:hypothetical protein